MADIGLIKDTYRAYMEPGNGRHRADIGPI